MEEEVEMEHQEFEGDEFMCYESMYESMYENMQSSQSRNDNEKCLVSVDPIS